jgi:hypothetical protein
LAAITKKERMCCVCRSRKPVEDLVRIARERSETGFKYFVDKVGNANGRGAYICHGCTDKAIKTRALNRSFKTNIDNSVYEDLSGKQ